MILVRRRLAPKGFNKKVYRPGCRWLRENNLPPSGPVPQGRELRPYWRRILNDLHHRYGGVCAYVCVYIDVATGARTVDHYIAKSRAIEEAYRWRNYRLASARMNGRKCDYTDVLDPFAMPTDTFHIELVSGRILANPALQGSLLLHAQRTIVTARAG